MKKWQEIWQEMSTDERDDALDALIAHLYQPGNDYFRKLQTDLARHLHFRPQTIRKLRPEAIKRHLRQYAPAFFEWDDWSRLFVHYYLACKQEIMCDFLDGCGIEHAENGAVVEGWEIIEPDNLQQIADELVTSYSVQEVSRYFSVLYLNHTDWRFLEAVMPCQQEPEPAAQPELAAKESSPEPQEEALFNDIAEGFTQLDKVIIDQIIACVAEEERALNEDQLADLVETVHALDSSRKRSYFHLGFMDALVPGKTPDFSRPEMNRERHQWYLLGVLSGFTRLEKVDEVVYWIEQRRGDFDSAAHGGGEVSKAMLNTLVPFLLEQEKIAHASTLLRGQLKYADRYIYWLVLKQAGNLLREGQLPSAKTLLKLLEKQLPLMRFQSREEQRSYSEEVQRKLGQAFQQGGELTAAEQYFSHLLERQQHNANLYADMGLVKGGFRGLQALGIKGDKAQRKLMLKSLEKGKKYYQAAVTQMQSNAINAHYALAITYYLHYMDVEEKPGYQEKALQHADNALAGIQSSSYASEYEKLGILGQCRFIAAVLKMMSLDVSNVQRAEQDWNAISANTGKFPLDHLERLLEAAEMFESEIQLRIAKSIWKYRRKDALSLIIGRDWAMQSKGFRQELATLSDKEELPRQERFSIWLRLIPACLREDELDMAEQGLDALEKLAQDDLGLARQLLAWLDDTRHYDPVWKEQDVLRAKYRLLMYLGEADQAWAVLRQLFYVLSEDEPEEAAQIKELFAVKQAPKEVYRALPRPVVNEELTEEAPGLEQQLRAGAKVRILFIGGNETQAQYNQRLKETIGEDWPGVEIQFEHTGWTSNWGQEVSRLKRDARRAHAVVLITMMRTMLGRTVRKMLNSPPRPWVPCTSTGKKAMEESIRKAALVGLKMQTERPQDFKR